MPRVMAFTYLCNDRNLQRGKNPFKTAGSKTPRDVKCRPTAAVSIELTSVRAVTSAEVDTAMLIAM